MAQDRKQLEALLEFIEELGNQPGNEWFAEELKAKYSSAKSAPPSGGQSILSDIEKLRKRISNIEKYLGLDYDLDDADSNIDYNWVTDTDIREQLIADNREMLRCLYGLRSHKKDFGEFCKYAHFQAEMLLNYFYDKKNSSGLEAIKRHIKRFNPNAIIDKSKAVGDISYNSKLWAFRTEFNLDIEYSTCLDYIRQARNESSHRSPKKEEETINETRKKLSNMGIPVSSEGYVQTSKIEENTNPYLLYNNVVKNSDWFKRYNFLIWLHKEPYNSITHSIEFVCQILKNSLQYTE